MKTSTYNRIKEVNRQLISLGYTPAKILKFWEECKREAKQFKLF